MSLSLVLGMYLRSIPAKRDRGKNQKLLKTLEGGEKGEQVQISEFSGVRENSNFSCRFGALLERSSLQLHHLPGESGDG